MATSGALSTSNDNIKYKITITQNSRNIANNTSSVTVSVRFYRTNTGYTTYGSGTVYCKINGTTYSESVTSSDKITSSGIVLFSKTLNIAHNADGGKRLTTSAWISHDQFSASEQSYSEELVTIPRATTPTVNDNDIDLGTSITISTPRASTSFTHTLKYTFGGSSGTIATDVATSKAWTPPVSLATNIPNATSGKLTIICETYSGSTKIGSASIVITVRVPSSVVPTISSVAISDTNSTQYSKMGGVVKGQSKLSVVISASGAQGSTISSISTTGGGKTYSGSSFTVNSVTTAGTLTFTVTVKDSRGRSATTTKSVNVIDYKNPVIEKFSVVRANADGTPNDEGACLLVTYGFTISAVNNKNDKSYLLEIKASNATAYTTLASGSVYTLDTTLLASNGISADASYDLRLTVTDYFKSVTHVIEASTAFTLVDYHGSGKGIAFGKVAEKADLFDVGLPAEFRSAVYGSAYGLGELPGLPEKANLNEYISAGIWGVPSNAIAGTVTNLPLPYAGKFIVEYANGSEPKDGGYGYFTQKYIPFRTIYPTFKRYATKNPTGSVDFSAWVPTGEREPVLLWEGASYMTDGQTATLSEPVSRQVNGIVLVFSVFTNGAVENSGFNSFFVPKRLVALQTGFGHNFFMTGWGGMSLCGSKYLYINDGSISGNENNNKTGAVNGITLASNRFVLRYVFGV